jgi:hypothetical protein
MKKLQTLHTMALLLFILIAISVSSGLTREVLSQQSEHKYLAIVIDDFGNSSEGTEEMLALPIKFTGAVMPKQPFSTQDAERLRQSGKAVILHQPMQAHSGRLSWLGTAPILGNMSVERVGEVLSENIDSLQGIKGFNNHMGSLITEDEAKMAEIMRIARERGLYFTDSVTTAKSVAEKAARAAGVPYIKRDVFLDSTQDKSRIKANLRKAADIAKKNGYALAIGHVGAEGGKVTAEAIGEMYKQLEAEGIEFVTTDELVATLTNLESLS